MIRKMAQYFIKGPVDFPSHIPEKLEETGVYGLAPPGGVPPFVAPTGAPTVPGPGF